MIAALTGWDWVLLPLGVVLISVGVNAFVSWWYWR